MSYARMGDDSDVYVFGTYDYSPTSQGHALHTKVAADQYLSGECCRCKLTSDVRKARTDEERASVADVDMSWAGVKAEDIEWDWGPVQHFHTKEEAIAHLRAHLDAGHRVPEYTIGLIEEDTWLVGE